MIGVIRLFNALSVVHERLSNIIISACASSTDSRTVSVIPDYMSWIVTVWHFGADAIMTYTGEKFYVSLEVLSMH